ncbi:uncharacterized protein EAE98_011815 [Botrytis deweyae]|uniref:Uncharacterized protein n=1 Tax=Botrytis deweyae TaxID=2478750 RepID=A0ABQ7I512_9HELO|nr:uncharacterized protein EAE98_011815 [Botrytis deweyae]KAF7911872.1 hypothetical protein EAE98_011815 [Botrytis deweyae]
MSGKEANQAWIFEALLEKSGDCYIEAITSQRTGCIAMPGRAHVLLPKSVYAHVGTSRASKALVHDHRNIEILSRRCKRAQYPVLESRSLFVDWGTSRAI